MGSRELILNSIRSALSDLKERPSLPAVPEVWAVQGTSQDDLLSVFEKNLTAVAGELVRCSDQDDAAKKIAKILQELDESRQMADSQQSFDWGVMPRPLAESVSQKVFQLNQGRLPGGTTRLNLVASPENPEDASPKTLQTLNASLVAAEFLPADTGSAIIRAASAFDRLLCYLSPVCLIVAKKSQLNEHLPQTWGEMKSKMGTDGAKTGEFLIMTGPSRTADIEKILVLGVHGPKKVVVLTIDNE